MKPITEQRWQELIEHCKRVMGESSPDGLEYPIAEIALASLTAAPVAYCDDFDMERLRLGKPTGVHGVSSQQYNTVSLYISPPVPVIKLPDKLSPCDMLPIAGEDAWNNCIDEMNRLNDLGE